ncbi:MAG: hypothetical protein L3K24_09350 [Gammaproteobacteria bacterium]|nr:hypothetical protein [Gammaproteobacteria bacterium]
MTQNIPIPTILHSPRNRRTQTVTLSWATAIKRTEKVQFALQKLPITENINTDQQVKCLA